MLKAQWKCLFWYAIISRRRCLFHLLKFRTNYGGNVYVSYVWEPAGKKQRNDIRKHTGNRPINVALTAKSVLDREQGT